MQRRRTAELMDDPAIPPAELSRALAFLRGLNRWFGGSSGLLRELARWTRRLPRGRPITLLDVATGSGDIPLAAAGWARRRGIDLRITGVDLHESTLHIARERTKAEPSITIVSADARRLMDAFAPGSFDFVHAGLFLHHLPDIEVLTVLRIMDRLARRGVVWNDLHRSPLCHLLARLFTVGAPPIVRHDARVSVEAGFTRREALDIARRVGLDGVRYRRRMVYRFVLTGERDTDQWD